MDLLKSTRRLSVLGHDFKTRSISMASDYTAVTYDVSEQIATITLNRPERMNSFSTELLSEWADSIRRATDDDGVRVVIVTGAGRAFCA